LGGERKTENSITVKHKHKHHDNEKDSKEEDVSPNENTLKYTEHEEKAQLHKIMNNYIENTLKSK